MGADYTKMRSRAEEGKLFRSPEHAFGLPTMPGVRTPVISPIIPTYTTTKKKKVEDEFKPEGGSGGDTSHGSGGAGFAG